MDRDPKNMQDVIRAAHNHRGTAFVEIYQNCNIFNDGAFDSLTDKETKLDNTVLLEHGKPLVFGKARNKGIRLNGFKPEAVNLDEGKYSVSDLLVHDAHTHEPTLLHLQPNDRGPGSADADRGISFGFKR